MKWMCFVVVMLLGASSNSVLRKSVVRTQEVVEETVLSDELVSNVCPDEFCGATVMCYVENTEPTTEGSESIVILNATLLEMVCLSENVTFAIVQCRNDSDADDETNERSSVSVIGIAVGISVSVTAVLVVVVGSLVLGCVYRSVRPKPEFRKERKAKRKRDEARVEQESQEQKNATTLVTAYLEKNEDNYEYNPSEFKLGYLGGRLQRYWFRIKSKEDGKPLILTIAPVSKRCAIVLDNDTITTLDDILDMLKKKSYPYVHLVRKISYEYSADSRTGYAIVVQDMCLAGSLRDYLHHKGVVETWTQYKDANDSLPSAEVKMFGRQILEALLRFYRRGIVPLGHLHTGNIFVELREEEEEREEGEGDQATPPGGDTTEVGADVREPRTQRVCRVGGYENMLLGYRTRLYAGLLKRNVDMKLIDIYLFGHVLYEMAEGHVLNSPVPKRKECSVKDPELAQVFEYIFNWKKLPKSSDQEPPTTPTPTSSSPEEEPSHPTANSEDNTEEEEDSTDSGVGSQLPSDPTNAVKKILGMKFFKEKSKFKFKLPRVNLSAKDRKIEKLLEKVKAGVAVKQLVPSGVIPETAEA